MTMRTERFAADGQFPEGTSVLVALSGGKDSVYLLHHLLKLAPSRSLTVGAAHLNHGLRGAESDRDEQFVRDLCGMWGVPLTVGHCDVAGYAAEHRMGIEEAARELRYVFLEDVRAEGGYDLIATGHQANDQAETMLFNLARGAGTHGLAGIPPKRENIVRPLLHTTGREIEAYLAKHGILYVEDSSNADDSYRRNLIRHQVIPVLEKINPRFVTHAATAAQALREDDACLQAMAEDFLLVHLRGDILEAKALVDLPVSVSVRVLRKLCGPGLTRKQAQTVLALCRGTERRSVDVTGRTVTYDQGRLLFSFSETVPIPTIPLEGARGCCVAGNYRISWEMIRNVGQIHNSLTTFYLKYENIEKAVLISPRRAGDRFRPVCRNCTKTLKALFQERHMTTQQREGTPVLRDEKGVAAVPGFGMDERFLPEIGDAVLCVCCEEYKEIGG